MSVMKARNRKLPFISEILLLHVFRAIPMDSDVSFYFMKGLESVSSVCSACCLKTVFFFFFLTLFEGSSVYLSVVSRFV